MKTYRFLEKRITWAALLLTLPLIPAIIIASPRRDLMKESRQLESELARHLVQKHGDATEPLVQALALVNHKHWPAAKELLQEVQGTAGDQAWQHPALRPAAKCLEDAFAPAIEALALAGASGIPDWARAQLHPPSAVPARSPDQPAFDMGLLATVSRAALAQAYSRLGAGELEQAIAWSSKSVKVAAPFRHHLLGHRLYAAAVHRAYEFYRDLLAVAPQVEAAQQEFERLAELPLPGSEPRLTSSPPYGDLGSVGTLRPFLQLLHDAGRTRVELFQTAGMLNFSEFQHLSDARNRDFVHDLMLRLGREGARRRTQGGYHAAPAELLRSKALMPPWTLAPALARRIERLARTEDELFWQRLPHSEAYRTLSPFSAALHSYIQAADYRGEGHQVRTLATERELIRAALAARLFRSRHGQWPKTLDELPLPERPESAASDRLVSLEEITYGGFGVPYPISLGMKTAGVEAGLALFGVDEFNALLRADEFIYLERMVTGQPHVFEQAQATVAPGRTMVKFRISPAVKPASPVLAKVLKELMQAHAGDLPSTVTAEIDGRKGVQLPAPSSSGPVVAASGPLSWCRELQQAGAAQNGPRAEEYHLHAEVEIPSELFAIWTPGYGQQGSTTRLIIYPRHPAAPVGIAHPLSAPTDAEHHQKNSPADPSSEPQPSRASN